MAATPTTVVSGTATSSPLALSGSTSGELLLLLSRDGASTSDISTGVTDSAGGTWTQVAAAPSTGTVGRRVEMWSRSGSAAITSVSVAYTGTQPIRGVLLNITGATALGSGGAAPVATFQSASTTPTPPSLTTTSANMLTISMCHANSNSQAQHTQAAGWTRGTTSSLGPAWAWRNDLASGVAASCQWTMASSVGSGQAIAAYTAAAAAGPTATVWNGTAEVAVGGVTVWNGTAEVAASLEQVI